MSYENENVTRKLRAILSADVKGYSLLMADDEVHTIQTLKAYRRIMSYLIAQNSGRVVDNPGDNLLAEFGSAVDAVECAVQVQDRLKKENAKFVNDKRLQFRIGINIGDVVHDDDRIYGSGVNIAARIEGLSDPGGICISRNAYDHVKDKLDIGFEYLGEHEVKNIKEPVRVYRVLLSSDSPKPLVEEQLELPDKPSIAVLPFDNMSGDPSQEYFSDGLTEQIINGLCKVSNLFVIGRNSSFAYKGKQITTKQIAKELGVRYILEGSVQKGGDRVRITAQLINATTDFHMWSETYDRDLSDIFALQDDITMKLISVMEVNLVHGEQARLWEGVTTKNLKAYDKCMRSLDCYHRFTQHHNRQAREFAEEAIALDSRYPFPYTLIGFSHWVDLHANWSKAPIESWQQMEHYAEKSLALSDSFDLTYMLLGYICLLKRDHDKAIEHVEKGIEFNPNGATAHSALAYILAWSGRAEDAVSIIRRAFRLNPIPPIDYYYTLAMSLRINGQYDETINVIRKFISMAPEHIAGHMVLTTALSLLGEYDKANESAKKILKLNPAFSIDVVRMMAPFKHQSELDIAADAFRKAGIQEHSPE